MLRPAFFLILALFLAGGCDNEKATQRKLINRVANLEERLSRQQELNEMLQTYIDHHFSEEIGDSPAAWQKEARLSGKGRKRVAAMVDTVELGLPLAPPNQELSAAEMESFDVIFRVHVLDRINNKLEELTRGQAWMRSSEPQAVLAINRDYLFTGEDSKLTNRGRALLAEVARPLQLHEDIHLLVESIGAISEADSGRDESWELGARQAAEVAHALVEMDVSPLILTAAVSGAAPGLEEGVKEAHPQARAERIEIVFSAVRFHL